jgi:nitrogen regulatory protein PII
MKECLFTLIASPSMEEALIDWLLVQTEISGFSTSEIYGHGSRDSDLNLLEQVTGRQRRVQFMTHTEIEIAADLILQLKQKFEGSSLHYFITPLIEAGQV